MLIILTTLIFGMCVLSDCSNIQNSNFLDNLRQNGHMEERRANQPLVDSRSGIGMTLEALKEHQRLAPQDTYFGFREFLPEDEPFPDGYTDTSNAPDICKDPKIDAITRTQNGNTYVFKGAFYWRVLSDGLASGYPRRITEDWVGLESNLDAALTSTSGQTFFFKDTRYWRFVNQQMDLFYPRWISLGFEGIPDNLTAALVWGGNWKPYFFKGSQYWRYDSKDTPPVKNYYPLKISEWNGLPNDMDAAFRWENDVSYFFKGDKYWKYNDSYSAVDVRLTPTNPATRSEAYKPLPPDQDFELYVTPFEYFDRDFL